MGRGRGDTDRVWRGSGSRVLLVVVLISWGRRGATYVPVVADVGRTLRVRVSASNVAGGPVVADSVQTAAVVAVSPPGAGLVVDASSSAASLGSVSSLSWSHTSSGVDRLVGGGGVPS